MPLLRGLSNLWRKLFHKARKDQELTEAIDIYGSDGGVAGGVAEFFINCAGERRSL
jgi:hypothetical protein